MDRVDRRTFLAGSLKAGAALATAGVGAAAAPSAGAASDRTSPASERAARSAAAASSGPRPPDRLTTTGDPAPVGVDPDDVLFAWRVDDARRGALQTGYHIVVSGPGSTPQTVWDSGEVPSDRQAFVAYAGPPLAADTLYRWRVSTADAEHVWSAPSRPARFRTGLRRQDWSALWLRPGPADPGEEEYTYLRTTRTLPQGTVADATAYVAAAHKYQLWVNGVQVDSGPSFCFPDEQYYQATDVSAALVAGRPNAVGILHHWYGPGRGRPASAPGLLAQVMVHYTDGRVVTLGTDGSWRSRPAEWLPAPQRNTDAGDFVEWIDARLHPSGWSEAAFDDGTWSPTAVRGPVGTAPFTQLYAQRTRIVEQVLPAVSLRALPSGSVVVDFGKVYAGRPTVSFHQGLEGRTVPMHVGYTLDPDGAVSTTHNTQATDLSFSYIQRDGPQTFEPYWYLGFRYLQVDDPGEVLRADQVGMIARHADIPEGRAATFSSSDDVLDAVWGLCAHSGLYTSQEQFIDTPTREKGQFLWDASNESETMMRTFGEQNLSWQGLRDMARAQARYWPTTGQLNEIYPNDDGPQDYPTFTARYPEWVWRYYLSTGDVPTVVALLPTLTRLSAYLVDAIDPVTGLVSGLQLSTNGDDQYGYDYDTIADTTLNILAVNALRRIADVATLAGDVPASATQTRQAAALTTAVNAHLVAPGGIYVDGLRAVGHQSPHSSQLANVAALAYGVAPTPRVATVADYVASLDISVEPDHGMELLRALHAAGRDADVVRTLTDPSFPGWAAILAAGGTFTWETWTLSDLVGDSMSHGWGSSALVAMQEALLGAVPTPPAPGTPPTVVTVSAPNGGLAHAAGTFPTPAGEMSIAWRNSAAGRRLRIRVPANAAARCRFAGATVSQISESGVPVDQARGVSIIASGSEGVILAVGAGSYDFTSTAAD